MALRFLCFLHGQGNTVWQSYATVGGGSANAASSDFSTVLGGRQNAASNEASVVLGGRNNQALRDYSVAGGAYALAIHKRSAAFGLRSGSKDVSQFDMPACVKTLDSVLTNVSVSPIVPVHYTQPHRASAKAKGRLTFAWTVVSS